MLLCKPIKVQHGCILSLSVRRTLYYSAVFAAHCHDKSPLYCSLKANGSSEGQGGNSTEYTSGGAYQNVTGHAPQIYKLYHYNEGSLLNVSEIKTHGIEQLDNLVVVTRVVITT